MDTKDLDYFLVEVVVLKPEEIPGDVVDVVDVPDVAYVSGVAGVAGVAYVSGVADVACVLLDYLEASSEMAGSV